MAEPAAAWSLADLVDLECLLEQDSHADTSLLHQRDRAWAVATTADTQSPPSFFRAWLHERRTKTPGLPGGAVQRAWGHAHAVLGLLGFFGGISTVLALLRLSQAEPVNLLPFFAVVILLPFLLFLLSLVLPFLPRRRAAPLVSALQFLIDPVLRFSTRHLHLPRNLYLVHHRVLRLHLQATIQKVGLLYQVGAFLALFATGTVRDLSFAWQTTLDVQPATLHRLLQPVAAPLNLLAPSLVPGEEQVAGSRLLAQHSAQDLDVAHLRAWWPFLLGCIAVYGLLVRGVQHLWTCWWLHRAWRNPHLDNADHRRVLRHAQTPALGHQDDPPVSPPAPTHTPRVPPPAVPQTCRGPIALQLTGNLSAGVEPSALAAVVQARFGGLPGVGDPVMCVRVQEAWRPPILQLLQEIRALRAEHPAPFPLGVLLVGKPQADQILTPPSPREHRIWTQALDDLNDPYLQVESMA